MSSEIQSKVGCKYFSLTRIVLGNLCVSILFITEYRHLGRAFESCVWSLVSSDSSHHPKEALLAQFSLYIHKGCIKFIFIDTLTEKSKMADMIISHFVQLLVSIFSVLCYITPRLIARLPSQHYYHWLHVPSAVCLYLVCQGNNSWHWQSSLTVKLASIVHALGIWRQREHG